MAKWHEQQTRKYFEFQLGSKFIERFTDAIYKNRNGFIMSANSPPDLIALGCTDGGHYLVESKVVNGKSIGFDRLVEHQALKLRCFDRIGNDWTGYISVCFYHPGWDSWKRMFLIPIDEWDLAQETLGRKSLPISYAEQSPLCVELEWVPGEGWKHEQ